MKTRTYTRDTSGLFDYNSRDFKPQEFSITESGVIALYKDDIVFVRQEVLRKDLINLLKCDFQGGTMKATHTKKQYISLEGFDEQKIKARKDYHERFVWRYIESERSEEYLDCGDIFRMGRMRFRVREIRDSRGERSLPSKGVDSHIEVNRDDQNEEITCRVCLEGETPEKQYANVCDCSKTMPIHAQCLMSWIQTKVTKKVAASYDFYTWKGLECDICKKTYPGSRLLKETTSWLMGRSTPSSSTTSLR